MSTLYSEIFDLFSGMITDYEHLLLPIETQDEILEGWLLNAIGEFDNCKTDLSDRNEELKKFNQTLNDKERKILARYILVEWMNPQLYSIDYFKSRLSSKDFNQFSPSNQLKEIRETHSKAEVKANREKNAYKHSNFDPAKDLKR